MPVTVTDTTALALIEASRAVAAVIRQDGHSSRDLHMKTKRMAAAADALAAELAGKI
jgi:hypothetical protein